METEIADEFLGVGGRRDTAAIDHQEGKRLIALIIQFQKGMRMCRFRSIPGPTEMNESINELMINELMN